MCDVEDTNCLSLLASVLIKRRDALWLALSLHLEIILQKERHKDKDHQSTVWCSLFKATKWQGLSQTFPIGCSYKKDKRPSWTLLQATSQVQTEKFTAEQNRPLHSMITQPVWHHGNVLANKFCTSVQFIQGFHTKKAVVERMRPSLLERIWIYQMARASCTNITEFFGYMHPWGAFVKWAQMDQIIFFMVNKMEGLI